MVLNEKTIHIDWDADLFYGSDQMCITYPVRFATVNFMLCDTDELILAADQERIVAGYKPSFLCEGYSYDDIDQNAWYDFYIDINDLPGQKLDTCITAYVVNSLQDDNEAEYHIDLSDEEQATVYDIIDKECRAVLGKSCEELLAESRAEMENT